MRENVIAAVVGAMALGLLLVGYREFDRAREAREAQRTLEQLNAESARAVQQWQAQQRRDAYARQQALSADRDRGVVVHGYVQPAQQRRHALLQDERCMGGVVVQVSTEDGVPTYRAVLEEGMPLRCDP